MQDSINTKLANRIELFPITTRLKNASDRNYLTIAGYDLIELADHFGTPLYIYDLATLNAAVETYNAALSTYYPAEKGITYAGKAYLCIAIAEWAVENNLWVDCTGEGELGIAIAGGVERPNIIAHGVNKNRDDVQAIIDHAGTIVVDNLFELERLVGVWNRGHKQFPDLWLRFRPGLGVETHAYAQTGRRSSKFGMDEREIMVAASVCRENGIQIKGLHFHLGSQFQDPTPIGQALDSTLDLVKIIGIGDPWALSPGGGWAVAYHEDDLPQPPVEAYVRYVSEKVVDGCKQRGLSLPTLHLEPGRSLVARAGVSLYRVGVAKQSANRRWLLVDGGMADNPRPALYGVRYSTLPVKEPLRPASQSVWIAGPYCESGDVIIRDLPMPVIQENELIAIPVSGAYQLAMSNNYNGALRPAVILLEENSARLIQARETVIDLMSRDNHLRAGR